MIRLLFARPPRHRSGHCRVNPYLPQGLPREDQQPLRYVGRAARRPPGGGDGAAGAAVPGRHGGTRVELEGMGITREELDIRPDLRFV